MPEYHIMNVGEYIDRVLREQWPDACRQPDAAPVQPSADSAEQIKKDFPWLYPDESANT